jgi:imidazole glycerol-phosphate synthase subunit HisF
MLSKRIVACLDVRDGTVVKGVSFQGLRNAGDPAELARRYNAEGIDELVILDVTATVEGRLALARTIADVSRELFIPLTVGGGISTEADAGAVIEAGADKVSINSAALAEPSLLTSLAKRYGSPGGRRCGRRQTRGRRLARLHARRAIGDDKRGGRVGKRGRSARCRRDPLDLD